MMSRMTELQQEFNEKLCNMLDDVLEIYSNAQSSLADGNFKDAERQLDAAERIVDHINTLLRGKHGRDY